MSGHTKAPDRLWWIVLAEGKGYAPLLLVYVLLAAACTKPAVHRATPTDSLPPLMACQAGDCHVLAGEWEYVDGAAVQLTLDEQGNGHYAWKDGRFETHSLIDHTWRGMWFQKENDREGGFTVEFSPDFSQGEGRWWVSRIGANQAPTQKEGTFHLSKKTALLNHSDTSPVPCAASHEAVGRECRLAPEVESGLHDLSAVTDGANSQNSMSPCLSQSSACSTP